MLERIIGKFLSIIGSSLVAMCCSESGKLAGYGIQPSTTNIKSLPDIFWQMNLLG